MAGHEVELAVVVSPREWAERLHRFTMDYGGARVRTRILSPDDALAEEYQVLVIDDVTSFLNRRLVQQLQLQGRRVLGVFDGADGDDGQRRLQDLGVDATIDAGLSAEDFLREIDAMGVAGPTPVGAETSTTATEAPDPFARASLVAVGSAGGGCGATEVALALAQAASSVARPVLIDLDNARPSIAQRLGLDLHPNLRSTVDALLHTPNRLESTMHSLRNGVTVISGLSNPADWIELRDGDVVELMREMTERSSVVIGNISGMIEDLAYYGGPGRFGLARETIRVADALVVVTVPTPIGVARLLDWIATARLVAPTTPVFVFFNRSNRSSYEQGELIREVQRTYSPAAITFLPADKRVHDAAWSGEFVSGGAFYKGVSASAPAILRSRRGAVAAR